MATQEETMALAKENKRCKDLHYLNENGMVACNPRDREAAHRAQVEGIATSDLKGVTCRKCRSAARKTKKGA